MGVYMKNSFLVYCFCGLVVFSNFSIAKVNENEVSKLNKYSEEILGISIPMLFIIVSQSSGGNLTQTSTFDADMDNKFLFQNLEKKGYVEIIRNAKIDSKSAFAGLAGANLSFVKVKLTEKGVKLKSYIQKILNDDLNSIKSK